MSTRAFVVARSESGRTVAAVVRERLSLSWSATRRLIGTGRVRVGYSVCRHEAQRLKPGQRLLVQTDANRPSSRAKRAVKKERPHEAKGRGPAPVVRFADAHVVVVDKPAGLTTVRHAHEAAEFGERGRRFLPPTLADLLPSLLAGGGIRRPTVRAVHRLDKDTSGLVVFARNPTAEKNLGRQFRAHTVGRRYLAVVRGLARPGRIESYFIPDRGDGRRGSSPTAADGKRAVTHVKVLESLGDFTLVECRLETGRTHQVRIHLGEAGTPLCGERVYDRPLNGQPLSDASGATRLALHAAELSFDHPASGKRMTWTSPLPDDLQALLVRHRRRRDAQRAE